MKTRPRKERLGHARAQILAAADRLFGAYGVQAVSLDDIAAKAELTKRTLYYHFASKEELTAAWVESLSAKTGLDAPVVNPEAEILGLFAAVKALTAAPGFRGCPFVATGSELVSAAHAAVAASQAHKEKRRKWFETRLKSLGLKHAASAANELMVLWDGAMASSVLIRDGAPALAAQRLAKQILVNAQK